MRPRLLDLFCGAGGAAVGYHRAGFEVVGVDIKPQPNYPFEFRQADALNDLNPKHPLWASNGRVRFDAIHASPPCQFATAYKRTGNVKDSPNLIHQTRELLDATGLPWVIENVEQASPWMFGYTMLCGTMFDPPMEIQRHRLFETSYHWQLTPPQWPCRHKLNGPRFPASTNRAKGSRRTMAIGQWNVPFEKQKRAMGIDWMTLEELSEAIPPVYTEFIGEQLMAHLKAIENHPEPDGHRYGDGGQILSTSR